MEKSKQEIAKELADKMIEIDDLKNTENLIKENEVSFIIEKEVYRVRKQTYEEQLDTETFRRKKYLEFLGDESFIFRKALIEKYKIKGIDIEKMQQTIFEIQKEIDRLKIQAAKCGIDSEIKKIKEEVYRLKAEQISIHIEVTDLLSYSIEDQLNLVVNSYYTFLVLEKRIEDKWERVFNTYEEFNKSENFDLISKAYKYSSSLMANHLEF